MEITERKYFKTKKREIDRAKKRDKVNRLKQKRLRKKYYKRNKAKIKRKQKLYQRKAKRRPTMVKTHRK